MAVRQQDRPEDEPRDPALERAYAASPREEPPSRLDAAILAAACREARARPRPLGARLRAWRAPVALAAVLVLSVTVVLLMREQGAERLADSPASVRAPVPAAEPERATEDARVSKERVQDGPAQPKSATREEDTAGRLRDAPRSGAASADEDRRKAESYPQQSKLEAARPAPRPFAEAPAPHAEQKLAAPEAPLPADALAKRTQPGGLANQSQERAEREQQPAQRPAAPPLAQAPPASALPDAGAGAMAPSPPRAARQGAPESGLAARPGMRDDVAATARTVWQGYEKQPPEKWLERIEELQRTGRTAEARDMLAEFRKRFPQHPIPATLER